MKWLSIIRMHTYLFPFHLNDEQLSFVTDFVYLLPEIRMKRMLKLTKIVRFRTSISTHGQRTWTVFRDCSIWAGTLPTRSSRVTNSRFKANIRNTHYHLFRQTCSDVRDTCIYWWGTHALRKMHGNICIFVCTKMGGADESKIDSLSASRWKLKWTEKMSENISVARQNHAFKLIIAARFWIYT